MNMNAPKAELTRRPFEPFDSALARLNQQHLAVRPERGNDQSRKPCASSEIEPGRCFTWNMGKELRAIDNVSSPHLTQTGCGYQVLTLVFLGEQHDQMLEPGHRRIVAFRQLPQPGTGLTLVSNHAASLRA